MARTQPAAPLTTVLKHDLAKNNMVSANRLSEETQQPVWNLLDICAEFFPLRLGQDP